MLQFTAYFYVEALGLKTGWMVLWLCLFSEILTSIGGTIFEVVEVRNFN